MENEFMIELLAKLDKKASKKQINADIKELQKAVSALRLTATLYKGESKKEINQAIRQMEAQLNHIRLKAKLDQKDLKSDINKALNDITFKEIDLVDSGKTKIKVQKIIADAKKIVQNNPISLNIELKKEKLNNQLTTYLTKNTKIRESDILLKEADKLRNKIAGINDRDSLRHATDSFQLFRSEVSATGYQSNSTTDKIKSLVGGVTRLGSVVGVASMAINKFQESLKTIKNNDFILTEISKTSNSTRSEIEKIGDAAFDTASKFGQMSSDYLTAVQEMNRSGFYGKAGQALGELSLKAQAAGNISADVSQKYLLATNAAYGYAGSVEKLTSVLDGQNAITNVFSVDMDQMSASTERAASVAANAGVSIEQLSAMIGTISSRTKESGDKTGTGIRSLLVNLQNISSSKIVDTLDKANASMTEMVNGTLKLRNPISILKDLAKTYNELDENDPLKSEITTNIGQKWHANQLSALLSGWNTYEKMLQTYANGTGSSAIEAQKTADSLEGRLNSLQNSWDELINGIVNKDALKDSITLFDGILQIAEKLVDTFDVIPLAVTGVTAAFTALNKDYGITRVFNENGKLDIGGNFLGIDFDQIKHFKEANVAIEKWNNELATGQADINDFGESVVKNTAQLRDYLSTCSADAPASLKGYKQHLQAAGISTDALRIKTVLLNSAISFGLGLAVQAAVSGIVKLANAHNETQEQAEAMTSSLNKFYDSFSNGKQKIGELAKKYEELSEGVDNAGRATKLSDEKYSEYKDTISQLSDLMPNLNTLFNEQGEKIGFVGGKLDDVNKKYQEYIQLQSKKFLADGDEEGNTYKSVLDDYYNKTEENNNLGATVGFSALNALSEVFTFGTHSAHDLGYDISTNLTVQGEIEQLEKFIELTDQLNQYEIGQFSIQPWEQVTAEYVEDILDVDLSEISDMDTDNFNTFVQSVYTKLDALRQEQEVAFSKVQNGFVHILNADESYWAIDDENVKGNITSFVQSMSSDFFKELGVDLHNQNAIQTFIGQIIDYFSENKGDINNAYKDLLAIDIDSLPINESQQIIQAYCLSIAEAFGQDASIVPILQKMFSIDTSETDRLMESVKGKLNTEDAKRIGELTPEELKIAAEQIEVPEGVILSWDELISKVNKYKSTAKGVEKPISFTKSWKKLGTTGDEDTAKAAEEAKEKLLELAEAGKLTTEAFEDSNIAQTILKETGLSAEEATAKINKLVENVKQLSAMRTGITSITSAYDEKKDNKSVSSSTLDSMHDTLGVENWNKSNKKAWENYKSIASSSKASLSQLKEAQDSLATSYVNSNNFLANITDSSYNYYVSLLREMGVTNAEAVATDALKQKTDELNRGKIEAALASANFQNATESDINVLFRYSKQLSGTTDDIIAFILQTALANQTTLQTEGSINNLISLISQIDATNASIRTLRQLMADLDALENANNFVGPHNNSHGADMTTYGAQARVNAGYSSLRDQSNKSKEKTKTKVKPDIKLTNGNKTGSSSNKGSGGSKPSKTVQTIDWIARKITVLNTALETAKKNFDAIFTRKKVDSTADLIKQQNKNLNDQIKLQKQLEKANNKAAKKYDKLAKKVGLSKKYKKLVNKGEGKGSYTIEDFVTTSSSGKTKGKGKKKVSESTYDKIQKYIDYRDKAESARQNAIQARVDRENARIQKLQNEQSRYDTLASAASAKQEYGSPKDRKEAAKDEWKWQKQSYDLQIKQAKLQKDTAKVKQLQAEKANAEITNKVKQLEIDKDILDTQLATYQAQQSNAKLKDTNSYVDKQIKATKELYKLQIKIAKAQGNTALAEQLEAEAQKANVDLLQQKVDNVKAYYNAELELLENRGQQIQNQMDLVDARGDILSTDYYDKLSTVETEKQTKLKSELQNLEGKLSGFTEGTQEWYDLNNSIQETKNAIAQSQKQVYDNTTATRELRDKIYDLIRAIPQNLADEYSFLGELVRGENTDSDTGNFTDAGLAKLYAGYMGFSAVSSNIKTDRDRLNEVESIYDDYLLGRANEKDTLSKAGKLGYNSIESLTQGIQEIRNKLQEDINNGKGYLDSIRDIVKDKMEAMVNYVSEIIEAHKEVLNQEKALYDYQRQMLEKTKTISNIEKQMAALRGDDSEEGRARLAKLQTQLDEANQDLKDTEYDKYISDQEDMLDQLLKEYTDIMERLQKDEDYMINHGFKEVNDNLIKMQEILNKIANAWSYPQSNDYKDSENDVNKDVNDGGISDYHPDNIVTKPGQKEENKVTGTLDEKGKDYLDKLNENSGSNNDDGNSGGNNSNSNGNNNYYNSDEYYKKQDELAALNHQMRADTAPASSGSFGANKTVADEKAYAAQAQAAAKAANERVRQNQLNAARSFIGANAQKAKKKRSELSYVNQRIYDATNGKVLSAENLKKLAKNTLKIEYDNAGKDGKLAKKLKEIRYSGFKTGGIAELMPKGEDGLAWVRNGEGFVSPEDVKHINKLLEVTPSMEQFVHAYDNIPKTTNVNNQTSYGDVSFNFELPNVVDRKDLLRTIQNDRSIQHAIETIAWTKPLGLNKYAVNMIIPNGL